MRITGLIAIICIGTMACQKDKDPRDPVPRIEVISIGPSLVKEYADSVLIVLEYRDGDGDLGGGPADRSNLFVIDRRIQVPFEFRIQDLVPGNTPVPVSGRLNLILENVFITNGSSQQQVEFEVYAIDQAGNESNRVLTPKILIYQ